MEILVADPVDDAAMNLPAHHRAEQADRLVVREWIGRPAIGDRLRPHLVRAHVPDFAGLRIGELGQAGMRPIIIDRLCFIDQGDEFGPTDQQMGNTLLPDFLTGDLERPLAGFLVHPLPDIGGQLTGGRMHDR